MKGNPDINWYQLSKEDALQQAESSLLGLSQEVVNERQLIFGKNIFPKARTKSILSIFFSQFLSPLIYVLLAAAGVCIFIGEYQDAAFITAIIVINAILGTYQEWRAESSAAALRNLIKVNARVKRGEKIVMVDSEELVPGDIVLLESGMRVPADLRLLELHDFNVGEALLTGESQAVTKNTDPILVEQASPGDQLNMAFAGTTVEKGRALGVVTTTGIKTEVGKIADSLSTTESERPPLLKRMDAFSKKISVIVVVICLLLGLIGWWRGMPLVEIFFFMIAVGVSAIPEGLPVALTVALSIGTRRMAKKNVIVRKLPAVEGLGSCTLIASDKTGTLTLDQQSVKKIVLPDGKEYTVSGQGYNGEGSIVDPKGDVIHEMDDMLFNFVQATTLCNESTLHRVLGKWEHSGDAVDVALLALAFKSGKDPRHFREQVEIIKLIPYESENKFSGIYYRYQGEIWFTMKGAVEIVSEQLSYTGRQIAFQYAENMAAEGYRVLAIASGMIQQPDTTLLPELELLGLAGLMDPLRPESIPAIQHCKNAGIKVVMVTGDHPATALTISKQLGIAEEQQDVMTGIDFHMISHSSEADIHREIAEKSVFARVTPLQKKEIVEALKAHGHFVSVTGDGANDAPALKTAHIGVAMGSGTDLAKDAASIIVTDNNFASITAGVEEGRYTYENLRKIIYLLISTGAAEILTVAFALFLGTPLPFLAIQLLWLNLVTNGIQDISLAFEKGDPAVMMRPPRKPAESIFDPLMNTQIILSGIVIAILSYSVWYYLLKHLHYTEIHARSVVMMLMVLLQNFQVLNCRSETKSIFKIPLSNNYVLIVGILLAQAVHITASYTPGLAEIINLEPVTLQEWLWLLPLASIILLVMEVFKKLWEYAKAR